MVATVKASSTRKFDCIRLSVARKSSVIEITDTSEVFFNCRTNSLPSGGMAMRKACGAIIWRMIVAGRMPMALDASHCATGTAEIDDRTISAT